MTAGAVTTKAAVPAAPGLRGGPLVDPSRGHLPPECVQGAEHVSEAIDLLPGEFLLPGVVDEDGGHQLAGCGSIPDGAAPRRSPVPATASRISTA